MTSVAAGTATVTVTATDPSGLSATQSFMVAVTATATGSFTDDPLVPGVTPVKAVHFTELRTRRSSSCICWELRSALAAAYDALRRSALSFTDASPGA